jgi:hypothetical protein
MAWRKDQPKEKKTEWKFKSMLSNCIHETLSKVTLPKSCPPVSLTCIRSDAEVDRGMNTRVPHAV